VFGPKEHGGFLLAPLPAAPAATKFVVNPHPPNQHERVVDEAEPTAPLLLLVAAISTAPPISRAFVCVDA